MKINSRSYRHRNSSESDDSLRYFNEYSHLPQCHQVTYKRPIDEHRQTKNQHVVTQHEHRNYVVSPRSVARHMPPIIHQFHNAMKREIIILHPPVKNFHPSMYSIDLRDRR